MSAYLIADVTVTDPEQYAVYRQLSTKAMEAHGAEVCVRGGQVTELEGDWSPTRIVVLKFPSVDAAQAYYDSVEYTAARDARVGAAAMRLIIVDGA